MESALVGSSELLCTLQKRKNEIHFQLKEKGSGQRRKSKCVCVSVCLCFQIGLKNKPENKFEP